MKILIAEDEQIIANSLIKNFKEEGYSTVYCRNGNEVLTQIPQNNFDVVLLDWRMPNMTGIEVCNQLRKSGYNKPIILLTALSEISNKIEALNLGADDYITKPFSFEELLARIHAVCRRYSSASRTVEFDNMELNMFTRIIKTKNQSIKLSEKEFDLLKYFLDNKGQILNKDKLCKDVWKLPFMPGTNIVEVTVKNLRKKLESDSDKRYIQTIYGEGYLFITE